MDEFELRTIAKQSKCTPGKATALVEKRLPHIQLFWPLSCAAFRDNASKKWRFSAVTPPLPPGVREIYFCFHSKYPLYLPVPPLSIEVRKGGCFYPHSKMPFYRVRRGYAPPVPAVPPKMAHYFHRLNCADEARHRATDRPQAARFPPYRRRRAQTARGASPWHNATLACPETLT